MRSGNTVTSQPSVPYERVLGRSEMPGADWFPGARLNYAEHALRFERPGATALYYFNERTAPRAMSWEELGGAVRILGDPAAAPGSVPGDRVAAYLPNSPHAIIAMLATTSIGAIWTSCGPDFGTRGVLDPLRAAGAQSPVLRGRLPSTAASRSTADRN